MRRPTFAHIRTKRGADPKVNAPRFPGVQIGSRRLPSTAGWPRQVTRPMPELYPETEHPQANLRVPANFARSWRVNRYAAASTIRRACIVANVPSGATMPQDAPGAVGEHGCRRRDLVTLPCAAARRTPPRGRWLAVLQRNGGNRRYDRCAAPCGLDRSWPLRGVMPSTPTM